MHLYCYILLELMENTLEEFAKYLTDTLDIKVIEEMARFSEAAHVSSEQLQFLPDIHSELLISSDGSTG